MAKLLYQGHGSYRITFADGRVLYFDPYAGSGYEPPADFILVTHQHSDHNQLGLITQKPGCVVITNKEALAGGTHNSFTFEGLEVEAVEAKNLAHNPKQCVGFLLTLDGVTIYGSGDTSKTKQMEELHTRNIDYALYCGDGLFNMSVKEAAQCAALVGAKHNIPIHLKPKALFDKDLADKFDAPNRLLLEPGTEIELLPAE
jgi:L-ascorbate metabolism protein UlaG (beta-lactamase superfamily)